MSLLFISHSSKDNEAAVDLRERLEARGHRSVFLDFDPEDGIPAGRDWEQELYRNIRGCRAVIVLCSRHSMASRWCFMEITHARALGKALFPIKIDDCELDGVVTDRQVIDVTGDRELAYERLWRGILAAGLDPADAFDWDARRPPFPGLLAFQEDDAAVFFGRDDEIGEGLDLLNRVRRLGDTRLVMVLGASGSGKSSLVRAGLLPRLRRDAERWLVVDSFRPRDDPLRELAAVLGRAFERMGKTASRSAIAERLRAGTSPAGGEASDEDTHLGEGWAREPLIEQLSALERSLPDSGAAEVQRYLHLARQAAARVSSPASEAGSGAEGANPLVALATDLRLTGAKGQARVLVVIDQFEELLGQPVSHPASGFLRLLRSALEVDASPLLVLGTMRSDFLGALQGDPHLLDLHYESLSLGPMSAEDIAQVIEKPAQVASIDLEPGLSQALIQDAETEDALPLLAFTLRELNERFGQDKLLQIGEYRDKLGGLQGAVAQAADDVVASARPTRDELLQLRRALLSLVRITDDGTYARRSGRWSDLPQAAQPLLERFVQARLLISGSDGEEGTLEVAHEALFRSWGRLRGWLDEEAEALRLRQEIQRAAASWDESGRAKEDLWRGGRLARAHELIDVGDLPLDQLDLRFVEASEREERALVEAEEARRKRTQRWVAGGAVLALILAAIAVLYAVSAANFAADARAAEAAAEVEKRTAEERAFEAEIAGERALAAQNFAENQRAQTRQATLEAGSDEARALAAIVPKYRDQSARHLTRAERLEAELDHWRQEKGLVADVPEALFSIEALRAKGGSSFLVLYGTPDSPRTMIFDGGPRGVYEALKERLTAVRDRWFADRQLPIELVASTQIDDEKIHGLVDFFRELSEIHEEGGELPFGVATLWSSVSLPPGMVIDDPAIARWQKVTLPILAQRLEIPVNRPFSRKVALPEAGVSRVRFEDGLSITVLGPPTTWLAGFEKWWLRRLVERMERERGESPVSIELLLDHQRTVEDFASDRIELLPSPIEIPRLAIPKGQDSSLVNLASLVLMLELHDRRMLLTSDARDDVLLAALAQAGYADAQGATTVDLLVLPHSGSDRNVSVDFFRRVKARYYLISGNGRHTNPEPATFRMLFDARREDGEHFDIVLTYLPRDFEDRAGHADLIDELCDLLRSEREGGLPFDVITPQEESQSVGVDLLRPTGLGEAEGTRNAACDLDGSGRQE